MLNEIVLRRRNKLTISNGEATQPNIPFISTMLKNIENLGYTFSADVIDVLKTLPEKSLEDFYLELVPMLKKMVGADVTYHPLPLYPFAHNYMNWHISFFHHHQQDTFLLHLQQWILPTATSYL